MMAHSPVDRRRRPGPRPWPTRGDLLERSRMIAVVTLELSLAGGGNPCPATKELTRRMRRPQVGDLVVEVGALRPRRTGFDGDSVGWLLELRDVDDRRDDWPPLVGCYVVRPLDAPGRRCNWYNADFVAVPADRASRWLPRG